MAAQKSKQKTTAPTRMSVATPENLMSIQFLGGHMVDGVTFTRDQHRKLLKVYGYNPADTQRLVDQYQTDLQNQALKDPKVPKFDPDEVRAFHESGSFRNIYRAITHDGLRVMAFLSQYLEPGQDPVKLVASICAEVGMDVPVDPEWYENNEGSFPSPSE